MTATLRDFYHVSQHVYEAAKTCLGETPAALACALQRDRTDLRLCLLHEPV